jgi:hypothetical protein
VPGEQDDPAAEQPERVHVLPVPAHSPVHARHRAVRGRGGRRGVADDRPGGERRPHADTRLDRQQRRPVAPAVRHHDDRHPGHPAREHHDPGRRGHHRCAGNDAQVDAPVPGGVAVGGRHERPYQHVRHPATRAPRSPWHRRPPPRGGRCGIGGHGDEDERGEYEKGEDHGDEQPTAGGTVAHRAGRRGRAWCGRGVDDRRRGHEGTLRHDGRPSGGHPCSPGDRRGPRRLWTTSSTAAGAPAAVSSGPAAAVRPTSPARTGLGRTAPLSVPGWSGVGGRRGTGPADGG